MWRITVSRVLRLEREFPFVLYTFVISPGPLRPPSSNVLIFLRDGQAIPRLRDHLLPRKISKLHKQMCVDCQSRVSSSQKYLGKQPTEIVDCASSSGTNVSASTAFYFDARSLNQGNGHVSTQTNDRNGALLIKSLEQVIVKIMPIVPFISGDDITFDVNKCICRPEKCQMVTLSVGFLK